MRLAGAVCGCCAPSPERRKKRSHRDGTVYGTSRSSTTSFFTHHLAAISAAVVYMYADALTLENAAATYAFILSAVLSATTRASAAMRLYSAEAHGPCVV